MSLLLSSPSSLCNRLIFKALFSFQAVFICQKSLTKVVFKRLCLRFSYKCNLLHLTVNIYLFDLFNLR